MSTQSATSRLLLVALLATALLSSLLTFTQGPATVAQDQIKDQTEVAQRSLPEDPLTLGPVIWSVLGEPVHPVTGSDGRIHLAYELHVTNVTAARVRIRAIEALDAQRGDRLAGVNQVVTIKNEEIASQLRRFTIKPTELTFARPDYTGQLGPGQSALAYFALAYDQLRNVPRLIKHRFIVSQPDENGPVVTTVVGGLTEVSRQEAVVLAPPLKGAGWLNANGCCAIIAPHRYVALPLNGGLKMPERFAIDFNQLDAQGRLYAGDPQQLSSYPFYGAEVVSSAPGRVVAAVNDLKDEVPGADPPDASVATAAGNHVIVDIGAGRFIMYAHLIPGSITVAKGDYTQPGQLLGRLGNSGNSSGPHLHFQVMDRPSTLNAMGLPFVFDHMQLQGRVVGTWAAVGQAAEAGQPLMIDQRRSGMRTGQMPLTLDVVGFRQ